MKIPAVWRCESGDQLGRGNAVNPAHPSGQVALIGETSTGRDFREPEPALTDKLNRATQSQIHNITIGTHAN